MQDRCPCCNRELIELDVISSKPIYAYCQVCRKVFRVVDPNAFFICTASSRCVTTKWKPSWSAI